MSRNILVFSDGTGQAGGLTPDENVSNIYKIFRATRCGPDSDIDPSEQLTFYDPGLGSQPESGVFSAERAYRWALQSRKPSDRARDNDEHCRLLRRDFADVAARRSHLPFRLQPRCIHRSLSVAAVLSLCGVPTTMADGKTSLFRDVGTTRKIAKEAVKKVYQHVSSPKDTAYLEQRKALALQFRREI